ncbi:hypothetical protein HanIR_Chr11g0552491 [Helianthus annuus]|nr:hypothetical protein HanIR_Chr11g0552491 [Helianthus annuus]
MDEKNVKVKLVYFLTANRINLEHSRETYWIKRSTLRVIRVHHQFRGKLGNPRPVGTTVKIPVKLVWLKDQTQVSLSLLSLPISVSFCTK